MKQQRPRYFKEAIYRIFVVYALIPIAVIALITYGVVFAIWHHTIIFQTEDKNTRMQEKLEWVVNDFISKAVELTENTHFYQKLKDPKYKSDAYQELYHITNSIEEEVDFYVLDKNFQMLAGSTREIPAFIPKDSQISWGITKRMNAYPRQAILECNKIYKDNLSRTKLLIGKAIVEDHIIKGYLIFVLYGDEFVKTSGTSITHIMVTDEYDKLFLASCSGFTNSLDKIKDEFKTENSYITIEGERYYKQASSIIQGELNIYTFTAIGNLYNVFIWAGIFFTGILVFLSIVMLKVAKKITKEKTKIIDKVVEAFQEVQAGNLDVTLHIKSYDEFEIIGESYNLMLASIKDLIVSNEEKIRQTSIAEIKQLESQFNPHFLFNTLEHIRYMTKLEPEAVNKMIVSLSSILRYSINNTILDVTIAEDLEYTKSYLLIQKYRFHERFNYTVYMERGTEDCIIPKLIFQPIIENAIKYGFGDKEKLMVRMKISFLADDLVIVIYDDGVGMQLEVLQELQELLKKKSNPSSHIGIYNVHRRIQLMYGKAYGIDIKSEVGQGTVVKIILPINKRRERDAEGFNCGR